MFLRCSSHDHVCRALLSVYRDTSIGFWVYVHTHMCVCEYALMLSGACSIAFRAKGFAGYAVIACSEHQGRERVLQQELRV